MKRDVGKKPDERTKFVRTQQQQLRIDERPTSFDRFLASSSSAMNVRFFIAEIKKRRALWDQSQKIKGNHRKDLIDGWSEVAQLFDIDVMTAKSKWKNLRDTFRVELKKTKRYSSPDGKNSYWAFYEDMFFLKDILKTRRFFDSSGKTNADFEEPSDPIKVEPEISLSPTRFTETQETDDNEGTSNFLIDTVTSMENETYSTMEHEKYDTSSRRKRKRSHDDDASCDDPDDDMLFFRSLLPFVRKLDEDKKLLFRSNVQQTLYNHLYNH